MKKHIKAFTLVELLVVIAIIAILSTAGILTYNGFIVKANAGVDSQLISDMNMVLIQDKTISEKTPENAHEAFKIASERIQNIELASKGYVIGWDSNKNEFLLIDNKFKRVGNEDDRAFLHASIWVYVDQFNKDFELACFNQCLIGEYDSTEVLETKVGVDSFDKAINILYTGDNEATFVTNGGTLTIDNENAEVYHYGTSDQVVINKCKKASYHLFGEIKDLVISYGEIFIEQSGKIIGDSVSTIHIDDENEDYQGLENIIIKYMIDNKSYKVENLKGENQVEKSELKILTIKSYLQDDNYQYIDVEDAKCHHQYGEMQQLAATCTEVGYQQQVCQLCGYVKRVEFAATGHEYASDASAVNYKWDNTHSKCTASVKCLKCDYVLSEESNASLKETDATCTKAKHICYESLFLNSNFAKQVYEYDEGTALGHDWKDPTYKWNAQQPSYEAYTVCNRCSEEIKETAIVAYNNLLAEVTTKKVLCSDQEITTYTPKFTNTLFANAQSKTKVTKEAGQHSYGTVTYNWSNDNKTCLASRECTICHNKENESADSKEDITIATCTADGKIQYTVEYKNTAFAKQSKTVAGQKALGHDWQLVSHTNPHTMPNATINGNDVSTAKVELYYDPIEKDEYKCKNCNETKTDGITDSTKYKLDYWHNTLSNIAKPATTNTFSFFYISDIHMKIDNCSSINDQYYNWANNFGLVLREAAQLTGVKNIIVTGDNTTSAARNESQMARDLKYVERIYDEQLAGLNVLTTRGNHDGVYQVSTNYDSQLKPSFVASCLAPNVVTGATLVRDNNSSYYYVDYPSQNVRVISLDSYWASDASYNFNNEDSGRYGDQQLEWLANTALNVPSSNYSIIIFTHAVNEFKHKSVVEIADQKVLFDLLKAYYNGVEFTSTYTSNKGTTYNVMVSKDFGQNITRGSIVGLFTGHCHMDNIDTSLLPFPVISIVSATNECKEWRDGEIHSVSGGVFANRKIGTSSEIAFDLVTVDLANKKVKLTRVGDGNGNVRNTTYSSCKNSYSTKINTGNFNVSGNVTRVTSNGKYEITITPNTGYKIDSVVVKMGGNTLSNVYSNNKVTINNVTGNIEVTVNVSEAITNWDVTLSNSDHIELTGNSTIRDGSNYTAKVNVINPNAYIEYKAEKSSFTVTVGGSNRTDFTYNDSTKEISVPNVTGKVVITAKDTSAGVLTILHSNKRISGDKAVDFNGYYISKGIKITKGEKLYLENMILKKDSSGNTHYGLAISRADNSSTFLFKHTGSSFDGSSSTMASASDQVKYQVTYSGDNASCITILSDSAFTGDMYLYFVFQKSGNATPQIYIGK